MKELFHNLLFQPLYNILVFLIDVIPGADVGLAVIALTVIVKLILFPLSAKAVRAQIQMKIIQKPLKEIQEKYKDKREEMGKEMLALYQKYKVNPFSGILVMIIQIPVILALYWVFLRGGFPEINQEWLYSFVPTPENVNMHFLGLFDVSHNNNLLMALLVALSQYFQARFSFPKPEPRDPSKPVSFQDDMMRGMQVQVKYVLPVIIGFVSYSLISVVSLYWIVSNLFAIGQEIYMRNHVRKPEEERTEKIAAENSSAGESK